MQSRVAVRVAVRGMVVGTLCHFLPTAASGQDNTWTATPQQAFLESAIAQKYQCVTCHTIADDGGTVGPILNLVGLRRSEVWLRSWLSDPNSVKPGTKMPKFPFVDNELETAVAYLSKMKRESRADEILSGPGSPAEKGEQLFADYDCLACHRVGSDGRFVGPDLTWIGLRKPETWERNWLTDPSAFKPGTFMPNFHLSSDAVNSLAAYLHELQGQENEASRQWEFMVSFMVNTSDVDRGEMVFKRLACWSCHGEGGLGGIRNPNAIQSHEQVPNLKGVRDSHDLEAFRRQVTGGTEVAAADANAAIQPYQCPAYPNDTLDRQELEDLYAYVVSFAPPKRKWTFK